MRHLTSESFQRPADLTDHTDPSVLYAISLLLIRGIVGLIGVLLPLILIVGETFFLRGGVLVRGSISAYYHTSMRDIFVACLCVIGFLLATYMAGQTNTKDFWLSFVAGIAVVVVALIPTSRPNLEDGAARCGITPMPEGCAPIQQLFGETSAAAVHFAFAGIFILSLAFICFVFAYRESEHKGDARMATTLRLCGWVIVGALAWVVVGGLLKITIWQLTPLYLGEVISVWAFGAAWLLKARDLKAAYRRKQN